MNKRRITGFCFLLLLIAATRTSAQEHLAVTFTSFTAVRKGPDVDIKWVTASETNNRGFDLERSINGTSFSKWFFIEGANEAAVYELTDRDPFVKLGAPLIYYRLKQIDKDGSMKYSDVVSASLLTGVSAVNTTPVLIAPNPVTDHLVIDLGALTGNHPVSAAITDIAGKEIFTGIYHRGQDNKVMIDRLAELGTGVYYLHIVTGRYGQVHKIVKQ
jgi:hypothetical protein